MTDDILIGVDLGSTKILIGAMNPRGKMLCDPVAITTGRHEAPEKVIARLTGSIDEAVLASFVYRQPCPRDERASDLHGGAIF